MPDVVVEAAEPTAKEVEDNFAAAFAQLTKEEAPASTAEKPAASTTEAKPAAAAEEKPAEKAAGDQTAATAEDAAEGEAEEKTDEQKAEEAAAAAEATRKTQQTKPDQASEDILQRLARLVKEPAGEDKSQQQQQQQPQQPQLTQEEGELVGAYVKDYPDIARAESIIRKQEYAAVVAYVFAEVAREMQPLAQMLQVIAGRTHLGDIQAAVPDYASTRDQVVAWVDKQPPYLKAAYQHVIQQGTVEEVTDLIKRYKAEHPTAAAADAATVAQASQQQTQGTKPATAAAKPAAQTEMSPAAKKAVAALAPVQGKRSGAVQTEPTTFDDAFAAAAKELERL
jgi:hypothetical protein